ncbi:MAG: CAP domain-containing protein [Bauldia sp.]
MRRYLEIPIGLMILFALGACSLSGLGERMGALVGGSVVGDPDTAATAGIGVKPGFADPSGAARLISAYRQSRGLSAVKVNGKLGTIAAVHARRMAATGRLDHVLPGEGSFMKRMTAGGYDASVAAENIGAGYDNLAEAIAGWKNSPHHNENLLRPGITEIGIAVANAPDGKFKQWWSLVLAAPYERPEGGPTAGPPIMIR